MEEATLMLDTRLLKEYFIYNEGWKPICYLDTKKIPTVGVGFNLRRPDARLLIKNLGLDYNDVLNKKVALRPDQIVFLLNLDISAAIVQAKKIFPNISLIDNVRQTILIDMVANMGPHTVGKFHKMIAAVNMASNILVVAKQTYWDLAAAEMKNSAWYHQVGDRGKRNVKAMITGVMPSLNLNSTEKAALIFLH